MVLLLGRLDRVFDQIDHNLVLNYNGYILILLTITILFPSRVDLLTNLGLTIDLLLEQRADTDVLPAEVISDALCVLGFLTARWPHEEYAPHYTRQLQLSLTLLVRLLDLLDQEVDRLLGLLQQ